MIGDERPSSPSPVPTMACPRVSTGTFVIAAALTVVGASTYNALPLLVRGVTTALRFSPAQAGVIALVVSVGFGISGLIAGVWVRSVPWPHAAVWALCGILVANTAAGVEHAYWAFTVSLGVAGIFGGSAICLGMTILSECRDATRAFGLAISVQVAYQVALFLAGPALLKHFGLAVILAIPVLFSVLMLPFAVRLPVRGRAVVREGVTRALLKPVPSAALVAMAIFFVNVGAFWTYLELLGESRGMSAQAVANCVAAGVAAGIPGGALAWALGERFGKFSPLAFGAVVTGGSPLILLGFRGVGAFSLCLLLYFFACNCTIAYQTATLNAVDITGRAVAVSTAIAAVGSAVGSGIAALLVTPGHYENVIWIGLISALFSTILFGGVTLVSRQPNSTAMARK